MQFTQILRHEKGRYWTISTQLLGELICPWENGKYGSMIDLYDSDTLRFIDYYYEPACDGKDEILLKNHLTEEDMKQCPIVAEGIVVYWMKECCDKAFQYDAAQLFDDYYDKCFKDYEKWQKRSFDYWKRKDNIPLAFAKKHLTDEIRRIATSKALVQYLPQNDIEKINDLTKNYVEYIKYKIKELNVESKGIKLNIFTEGHNVAKIVNELKKIDKTGFGPKQFVVIVKEFFVSISWLSDTSDVNVLKWMKQNKIVVTKATKLQNVSIHKNRESMLELLRNTFQRLNAHYVWEDKQEFYLPGVEKINQG